MLPLVYRRIGFLGDVHAEDERLAIALAELRRESVDVVLCVGDIADGRGDLERTISLLRENAVLSVRGNHERYLFTGVMRGDPDTNLLEELSIEARDYLASLPDTLTIETMGGRLALCHGLGDDDMGTVMPWDDAWQLRENRSLHRLLATHPARFYLNGHSHRRMARSIGGSLFLNAGTLFREHDPCFGLLDLESGRVQFRLFGEGSLRIAAVEDVRLSLEKEHPNDPDREAVTPRVQPNVM